MNINDQIYKAYENLWGPPSAKHSPQITDDLKKDYPEVTICEYPPSRLRDFYIYATVGMSELAEGENLPELHIFSETKDPSAILALSSFIEFVSWGEENVNYGNIYSIPEKNKDLSCSHLLATFALSDGEGFPEIYLNKKEIHFLWLLPITPREKQYIEQNTIEAFEDKLWDMEGHQLFWDRKSII